MKVYHTYCISASLGFCLVMLLLDAQWCAAHSIRGEESKGVAPSVDHDHSHEDENPLVDTPYVHRCIHDDIKMKDIPTVHVSYGVTGDISHLYKDTGMQTRREKKSPPKGKPKRSYGAASVDLFGSALRYDAMHNNNNGVPSSIEETMRSSEEGDVTWTTNRDGFHRSSVPLAVGTWNNIRLSYFFNVDGNGQCATVGQQVPSYKGTIATCTANDILTPSRQDYIMNTLMSQGTQYLSLALNVVPVVGNLSFPNISKCGGSPGITIPPQHRTFGVPDTDFVLYVTANPQTTVSQTVAFASTCARDQNGRPIAGSINFVPSALSNADTLKTSLTTLDVNTAIHETCHALGFSSPFFSTYGWVDLNGTRQRTPGYVVSYDNVTMKTVTYMTTPRVLREAQNYFGCTSLSGVEIEDQGGAGTQGSHWEKRIFYQEFIAGILCTSITYISSLTLAYFEDTGFYTANYAYAQNDQMTWGKSKGCNFVKQSCNSASNKASGEFCFDQNTNNAYCTYDLTAGGYCGVTSYTTSLLSNFQYFSDPKVGSVVAIGDYCPAVLPFSNKVCIEPSNVDTQDIYGNTYHSASRCFVSNLIQSDFDLGTPQDTRCFPFSCSIVTGAILLNIQGQTVRCPSNLQAGYADVSGLSGFHGVIYCPAATTLCADPNAPTPAPTPAPPTPVPTPAPPGYTAAPAPVVRTAKLWYNFGMPGACADRISCASNLTKLFPACRLIAKRLVDCFGTNCDAELQAWLSNNQYSSKCSNMESLAAQCQESWQGAAQLCTLVSSAPTSSLVSFAAIVVVALATVLWM